MLKTLNDLSKLVLLSEKGAFKNNNIYEGTLQITGTTMAGANTRSFTVPLERVPDIISGLFGGPTDTVYGSDPRPNNAWFKKGSIWVLGSDAGAGYVDYPTSWSVELTISGANAIIKLTYIQQFIATLTLNNTNFTYRILDYSVF